MGWTTSRTPGKGSYYCVAISQPVFLECLGKTYAVSLAAIDMNQMDIVRTTLIKFAHIAFVEFQPVGAALEFQHSLNTNTMTDKGFDTATQYDHKVFLLFYESACCQDSAKTVSQLVTFLVP